MARSATTSIGSVHAPDDRYFQPPSGSTATTVPVSSSAAAFTAPATAAGLPATAADLDDPGTLLSRSYDLVLDGSEIGGGSIRNHRTDVQQRIFELIGIGQQEAKARFGFLLEALRYGAPPHGGIALGVDRIVAICAGRESIRDVIAFPKTASGMDPLTGAPAPVDSAQLRELGLRTLA